MESSIVCLLKQKSILRWPSQLLIWDDFPTPYQQWTWGCLVCLLTHQPLRKELAVKNNLFSESLCTVCLCGYVYVHVSCVRARIVRESRTTLRYVWLLLRAVYTHTTFEVYLSTVIVAVSLKTQNKWTLRLFHLQVGGSVYISAISFFQQKWPQIRADF